MKKQLLILGLLLLNLVSAAQIWNTIPAGDTSLPGLMYYPFGPADTAGVQIVNLDLDGNGTQDLAFGCDMFWVGMMGVNYTTMEGMNGTLITSTDTVGIIADRDFAQVFAFGEQFPRDTRTADSVMAHASAGDSWGRTTRPLPLNTPSYLGILLNRNGTLYPAWIQVIGLSVPSHVADKPAVILVDYGIGPTPAVGITKPRDIALKAYPNPTQGLIRFETEGNVPTHFTLTDLKGRVLREADTFGTWELDLSAFAKGIYLCKAENEQGLRTEKVVVE